MTTRHVIATALREALEADGISQVEFAKRAGLSPKHINMVLHEHSFTSPEALDYWAFLLGRRWEIRFVPIEAARAAPEGTPDE